MHPALKNYLKRSELMFSGDDGELYVNKHSGTVVLHKEDTLFELTIKDISEMAGFKKRVLTKENIDDLINEWHEKQVELHDYLGLTFDEYTHWVKTDELPSDKQ